MPNFCQYTYIVGAKKGQQCKTLLRGGNDLCYRHKKFKKEEIPESQPVIEKKPVIESIAQEHKVESSKPNPLAESTMVKKKEAIQLQLDSSSDSSDFSDSDSDSSSLSSDSE